MNPQTESNLTLLRAIRKPYLWKFTVIFCNGKSFRVSSLKNAFKLVDNVRLMFPDLTFRIETANNRRHERSNVHH